MSKELIPPCSYQGGKQRLSSQIIDIIDKKSCLNNSVFIDFCCGSGAISLDLINNELALSQKLTAIIFYITYK